MAKLAMILSALFMASTGTSSAALDKTRLPLGDGKYRTSAAKGYVYSCSTSFRGGGAQGTGSWINSDGKTWDLTKKISVQGSVKWSSTFTKSLSSNALILSGNGLPSHSTGVFPVSSSDPAYQVDRNPNSIQSYALKVSLPRNPKRNGSPACVGGTIGVMRSGIPLYSAFDAAGRDAAAREVQDRCSGHPQMSGQYHYHSLPACISDTGSKKAHSQLIGWALDGFGIYGTRGEKGEQMSTSKLDACHGHTHTISWNGKRVKMFHYHATLDFPYVVSCYRGSAVNLSGDGPPGGGPPAGSG